MHAGNGQLHQNEKSRQLQRRLYLAAKKCRDRRFHALYDRIFRPDVLWRAWEEVKANGGSAGDLVGRALYCRGVGYTPVSGHRLSRPNWADLLCGVVADGEHEVHLRCTGPRKFAPILCPQASCGKPCRFYVTKRNRVYGALWVAPCAVGREIRKS